MHSNTRIWVLGSLVLLAALAVGCSTTPHRQSDSVTDGVRVCRSCYDAAEREVHLWGEYRGGGWRHIEYRRVHQCPECGTDVSIYEQDGKLRLRCAKCAPEDVDCDKCLPPIADRR